MGNAQRRIKILPELPKTPTSKQPPHTPSPIDLTKNQTPKRLEDLQDELDFTI